MQLLDFITIIVFIVGIIIAGLSFSSRGNDMKSFFAAGGHLPWWISGLSLFMGFFSAGTFVVWGSIAYSQGLVAVTIQCTMCVAGFVVGMLIAPRWHDTGALTVAEYINKRLGYRVQKAYTYLFLLISVFTTGSFLYPVAKIVEISTGIPLVWCILLIGFFSMLYVTAGGLWAVVVTDVLQFVILMAAVVIVIPLSFHKVGGIHQFLGEVPAHFFSPFSGEFTLAFILAFCFYNIFFLGGNWSYVQRYTSVHSRTDARKVGILFGALYIICPILWMLPPMIYRTVNPSLSGLADEGAYMMMCKDVLPSGLLGLMLGGMIFATASSLNGALNISSGVFTNDIYKKLFPLSEDFRLMRVARISTVTFGLLAIVVALFIPWMGGIVNVVISIAALTGVPLYLPIIWTLFSKRQTAASVMTATVLSLFINGIFKFVTPHLFSFSFNRTEEMLVGVLTPIVVLLVYEIYAKSSKTTAVVAPVDEETRGNNMEACASDLSFPLKVIGIGVMSAGFVIQLLGVLSSRGLVVVSCVSLVMIATGIVCIYRSKQIHRI